MMTDASITRRCKMEARVSFQTSAWTLAAVLPESPTHILDKLFLIIAADIAGRDGKTLLWSVGEHAHAITALANSINIPHSTCESSFDRLLQAGYFKLTEVEDFGAAYVIDLSK